MTRLLALILIVVGVIGYHRGWLQVATAHDDGTTKVNVSIDDGKFQHDRRKVGREIEKAGRRLQDGPAPAATDRPAGGR